MQTCTSIVVFLIRVYMYIPILNDIRGLTDCKLYEMTQDGRFRTPTIRN